MPKNIVSKSIHIDDISDDINLSSNNIKIDTNISLNTDIFMVLIVVGLVFSLGFLVNIINYSLEISKIDDNITASIEISGLPKTSFELEAMEKQTSASTKEQINIRKYIKQISTIKTSQYGKIKKLKITKEKLSVYDQ